MLRASGGTDDQARAHQLRDLQAHQADAGRGALNEDAFAALQPAVADERIVHGEERERQHGGLVQAYALRHREHAARERLLGIAARPHAHHALAGIGPLACPVHARNRPLVARRAREVAPVEARVAHAHQHLAGLRLRLGNLPQFQSLFREYRRFHVYHRSPQNPEFSACLP